MNFQDRIEIFLHQSNTKLTYLALSCEIYESLSPGSTCNHLKIYPSHSFPSSPVTLLHEKNVSIRVGRGDSHLNRTGELDRPKVWKKPRRTTKILFFGRGLKFYSPLRCTNSKTTHYWQFKTNVADVTRLNTTKTSFLTPEKYEKHPCPFYMGIQSPWGHNIDSCLFTSFSSITLKRK